MNERAKAAFTLVKCLIPRFLFTGHILFTIWSINCVTGSSAVWAIIAGLGAFVYEAIYRIAKKKCKEPKWFSPCICLYLLTIIPPIWILNLDLLQCLKTVKTSGNGTCIGISGKDEICRGLFPEVVQRHHISSEKGSVTSCFRSQTIETTQSLFPVENYLSRKPLVYTLEEVMLLLLILGRWILPTSHLSREQLSQLLFVYFGISFDIMELFQLFEEPAVLVASGMPYAILTIWSISLIQFTIVLTVLKTRKPGLAPISVTSSPLMRLNGCRCFRSGIWSLLTNLIVQDIPFLCLRMHCLVVLRIYSYNLIFYTFKNILVIVLQTYRFAAIMISQRGRTSEGELGLEDAASPAMIDDLSADNLNNSSSRSKTGLSHSTQQLTASAGSKDSLCAAGTRSMPRSVSYNALQRTESASFILSE